MPQPPWAGSTFDHPHSKELPFYPTAVPVIAPYVCSFLSFHSATQRTVWLSSRLSAEGSQLKPLLSLIKAQQTELLLQTSSVCDTPVL